MTNLSNTIFITRLRIMRVRAMCMSALTAGVLPG